MSNDVNDYIKKLETASDQKDELIYQQKLYIAKFQQSFDLLNEQLNTMVKLNQELLDMVNKQSSRNDRIIERQNRPWWKKVLEWVY